MTDTRFELCLPYILKEEGGNDDDPQDHGGRTSRGIIQREYDKWRSAKGLPVRDVWTATNQEVHDIYYEEYWLPTCPKLAPGVDLAYFNIAVNGGVREATVLLQRTLNIAENSVEFKSEHEYVGPLTLKYATAADAKNLVGAFSDHIMSFYRSLKQFPRYGNDWTARTGRIRSASLKMAPPSQPQETKPMPPTVPAVQITDPIPEIIKILEMIRPWAGALSAIPGPIGSIVKTAIPIIEEILQLVEDAKTKTGVDLFQTLGAHIQAIGQQVQTTASTAAQVTTTQGAPTSGMPNS